MDVLKIHRLQGGTAKARSANRRAGIAAAKFAAILCDSHSYGGKGGEIACFGYPPGHSLFGPEPFLLAVAEFPAPFLGNPPGLAA